MVPVVFERPLTGHSSASTGSPSRSEKSWRLCKSYSPTAPQFDAVARQGVTEGATEIELDAAELGFMDSTGLSVVAALVRHLRPSGGRLVIRHGPPLLVKLLEITALRDLVD